MPQPLLFAALPALYSLTLFVSAGLLFAVELMIAKMILPLFGGTPAVWNTCMMFFQALLLAGYAYAHLSGTRLALNRQITIHLATLAVACIFLPVTVPRGLAPEAGGHPTSWIILLLTLSVGLPFFGLSATTPLLQKWFTRTGHPSARDPYFLYSASNLGSMLTLLGYPLWIEPQLRLVDQGRAWAVVYVVLLLLSLLCALSVRRYAPLCALTGEKENRAAGEECKDREAPLSHWQRIYWVLLAFVPSSLMLGVTTFLSTDVAAIPLFWVVPLALYLLSFILVFARIPPWVHRIAIGLMPAALAAVIFADFSALAIPKGVIFTLHLLNLFVCAMVCHGQMARTRPAASHLTEFYLWMSVGGVLGGVFNSLAAPILFETVFEYPLILAGAALLLPVRQKRGPGAGSRWFSGALYVAAPSALGLAAYWVTAKGNASAWDLAWIAARTALTPETLYGGLTCGGLLLACLGLLFFRRPLLFGAGIAAVLLTMVMAKDLKENILHRERSFFGVLTVARDSREHYTYLSHGTTLHGMQRTDPWWRHEPVAYYHPQGPAGQAFAELPGASRNSPIAVTGLGAGSMVYFAGPGQPIDFYEID
ncbi:MAG: hypothetical protein M0009_13780, partial [Deltaproteobacteria bacterium]|nr:hypothetical protein [Deltaproteobacteria bacterium]